MLAVTTLHGIGGADDGETVLSAEPVPAVPPMPAAHAATSIEA